jgi:hypothetical protein
MTRLKEERIRERIKLAIDNMDFAVLHRHEMLTGMPYEYWMGYLNALRLVVKMPPDDEVEEEGNYD